jgi:hypothetical protein
MIAILTIEQKDLLIGQQYAIDSFFNPIQDFDNNWVISQEEMQQNTNDNFSWLADLELTEYKPKEQINFI